MLFWYQTGNDDASEAFETSKCLMIVLKKKKTFSSHVWELCKVCWPDWPQKGPCIYLTEMNLCSSAAAFHSHIWSNLLFHLSCYQDAVSTCLCLFFCPLGLVFYQVKLHVPSPTDQHENIATLVTFLSGELPFPSLWIECSMPKFFSSIFISETSDVNIFWERRHFCVAAWLKKKNPSFPSTSRLHFCVCSACIIAIFILLAYYMMNVNAGQCMRFFFFT